MELAPSDSRSRLSAHPRLFELVRIAGALGRVPADIVLVHDNRAHIVASLGRSVLQPRPLTASERALLATTQSTAVRPEGMSFAIRDDHGVLIAALTFTGEVATGEADALHAVVRLIAELLDDHDLDSNLDHAVLEGVRDAVIVVDRDFVIRYANRAVGNQFGRTPAELLGTNGVDLIHPDDIEIALEAMARLASDREVYRIWLRVLHASGRYCPVEIMGNDLCDHPLVGGFVLSLRSDERDLELQVELDKERKFLSAILDQLHDGILATDRLGEPTLVNQAARAMHGLPLAAPARELTVDALFVLDELGNAMDVQHHPLARVGRGERISGESMSMLSEGHLRYVKVSGQPVMTSGGEQLGSVVSYHDVTEALQAERELRERALHDQLTGLPNRRQLHDRLVQLATDHDGEFVAACFIDLDGFKLINDTFGHRTGDSVIRVAARRLSAVLGNQHFLARLGGDEFIAILGGVASREEAVKVAESIRDAIRPAFIVNETSVALTTSIGLALAATDDVDEDALLRNADVALYAAKARGRNRVEVFDEELALAAEHESRQHEMLRSALDRNGLVMHFQPLVDSDDGRMVGFEALARCRLADGSLVGPSSFMEAAISSGLICELDRKAFDLSCAAVAALESLHPGAGLIMSCNFSALSIVQPSFVADVLDAVSRHGIEAASICVEITESTAFEAGDLATKALRELHSHGFRLALDDFGTGYSSLAHLRDLPLATVKVDRSFVSNLGTGTSERAITEAVVHLAGTLNLSLVAEGVENSHQLKQARDLGFRVIQGWYYSAALPLTDIIELMAAEASSAVGLVPHSSVG